MSHVLFPEVQARPANQGEGVAALVQPNGPEGGTLQYSGESVYFRRIAEVRPPQAPGPYRRDEFRDDRLGVGIGWGLHISLRTRLLPYLERFTCVGLTGSWYLPERALAEFLTTSVAW